MTVVESPPMKVHLDRVTAGFHVEVGEVITTGEWVLQGTTDTYRARVPILPEQRINAYLHPCAFLPHPDRFFRELKEGEVADVSAMPDRGKGMNMLDEQIPDEKELVLTLVDSTDPSDFCAACNQNLLAHEDTYCDRCNGNG